MGPIQDFLGRSEISAQDRDGHEMVLRNSKYLLRLINQILDLARLEAGEIQLQATHGDLAELVRDDRHAVRADLPAPGYRLGGNDRAREHSRWSLMNERMEQVVANLLSNAIKFTPASGEVRVELTEHRRHDQAQQ
jgi:signal transduction histidine kinase